MRKKNITAWIDEDVYAAIEAISFAEDRSKSEVAARLISSGIGGKASTRIALRRARKKLADATD